MFGFTIFFLYFVQLAKNQWAIDDSGCITPNSAVGDCIPIKNCKSILDVIVEMDPLPPWLSEELSRYQCGFTKTSIKVCCPYDSKTLEYLLVEELLPNASLSYDHYILPDNCGVTSDDYHIVGGDVTKVFQFPWMVLLSYKQKNVIEFKCAGSIISEWYILTAAHCISNLGKIQLIGVRAGEHNISSKIDCDEELNSLHCAESVQDVGIANIIPHPKYNSATYQNDIGLIRLSTPLNTSVDNVKPICLPVVKEFVNLNLTGKKFTVTGWGWTEKGKGGNVAPQFVFEALFKKTSHAFVYTCLTIE